MEVFLEGQFTNRERGRPPALGLHVKLDGKVELRRLIILLEQLDSLPTGEGTCALPGNVPGSGIVFVLAPAPSLIVVPGTATNGGAG